MRNKAATPATKLVRDVSVTRRYLNRREAAAYLGFSFEKFKDHVQRKEIAEYSFGRSCKRYTVEDLDAFALARRTDARCVRTSAL
jgi:hypothetical protein